APLAGFWLGRAWGLRRPGAWAVGTTYAFSGYFLSQLNLYNLIAAATWTPALIAATLDAGVRSAEPGARPADPRRGWAIVGLLWALILAGGDPMSALLAGLLATSAVAVRIGWRTAARRRIALVGAGAFVLGTAVVAPMLVELARILPVSHRAAVPSSAAATLAQSVDPRSAIEWFLPLAFGDVGQGFWGQAFYGGNPPLFYSLAPGVLVFALLWVAGRSSSASKAAPWAWAWIGLGSFFALGWHNPLIRWLVETTGASLLRYPVKVWMAVAIGGALLAGMGFDRATAEGGRRLTVVLGAFVAIYAAVWIALVWLPGTLPETLRALDPRFAGPFFTVEHARWLTVSTTMLGTAIALWLGAVLLPRRPTAAAVLLLIVHVGSQSTVLASLADTDHAEVYRPAEIVDTLVPADARVAHGAFGRLFGTLTADASRVFPDLRLLWQTREDVASMGPGGGILHDRRYALNRSPERLDTYPSCLAAQILPQLDDPRRVRLLEADGVDRLIVPRPLVGVEPGRARLLGRQRPSPEGPIRVYDLHVYALDHAVPDYRLVGRTVRGDNLRHAVETLASPEHDPATTALLPADGGATADLDGSPGTVEVLSERLESVRLAVDSPNGGVVVSRRAWLPVWRAEVDGEAVDVELVDLHKLGVRVPPGTHEVRLWIDRRPTRAACGLALVALAVLVVALVDRRR
ncbi:MAG: hypothetical protein AAGE94_00260, partial [Acidobacteriota bacterium]